MKIMILLLSLSFGVALSSCESEYHRQMAEAQNLVRQEIKVRQAMQDAFTSQSVSALSQLRHEIDFHAHISGNKTVFMQELDHFKQMLAREKELSRELISKYP